MSKQKKTTALIDSDSDDGESGSILDEYLKALARRKRHATAAESQTAAKAKSDSESETSESDEYWNFRKKGSKKKKAKSSSKKTKRKAAVSSVESGAESNRHVSESEEGEVPSSDEGAVSDSDQEEQFDDGYDENLIGDEEDRLRLEQMTKIKREQEMFNRVERREALKIRFEIEKKLKQQRKKEQKKKEKVLLSSVQELKDLKSASQRSIERRENMEEKKDNKKFSALTDLMKKREEKKKIESIKRFHRRCPSCHHEGHVKVAICGCGFVFPTKIVDSHVLVREGEKLREGNNTHKILERIRKDIVKLYGDGIHACLLFTTVDNPDQQSSGFKAHSPLVETVLSNKEFPFLELFSNAVKEVHLKGKEPYTENITKKEK